MLAPKWVTSLPDSVRNESLGLRGERATLHVPCFGLGHGGTGGLTHKLVRTVDPVPPLLTPAEELV
jgi:hypothetical protein